MNKDKESKNNESYNSGMTAEERRAWTESILSEESSTGFRNLCDGKEACDSCQ